MIYDPFLDPPRERRSCLAGLFGRRRHRDDPLASVEAFSAFRAALRGPVTDQEHPMKFTVAPPTRLDRLANAADPGCELCGGLGHVKGAHDGDFPDGVTPCYCTGRRGERIAGE